MGVLFGKKVSAGLDLASTRQVARIFYVNLKTKGNLQNENK